MSPPCRAVADFRTGVRGARLVPLEARGSQNLFDVHRSAKQTANLRHWVGGWGLKAMLHLWLHIDKIRHCCRDTFALYCNQQFTSILLINES
ncbi:hypothetical protein AVEN_215978-1 [Araneus ventricosus]|uniref:Uncharacterized protein n=1 Tax=Araneus ventricosus TaxID=182803 RepID=A0A4Y2X0S8_ARAVE|nr:hypothetical protein AVEN_272613-1 [Araneus ventricosus]GBO42698.1 hypothetical protein AVEN_215978-1 [Araneus ventricosus]